MSMEKDKIKIGTIKEDVLVESFGSDSQKKSYAENGHFVGTQKKTLLSKMERYCNIKDLGNRKYRITKIYDYPIPANFNKMNKSLYQYICPLLLTYLINGYDKNHKIDITTGRWARTINMVNQNYRLIKYNKEDASKEFDCNLEAINQFYEKTDDMIDWYITNALDYLKSAGLIIWRDVYRINVEHSTNKTTIDENGTINTEIIIDSHQASKEEMEYYSQCIKIADGIAGIENNSERYYSKKAKKFNEALRTELYKRKIKCVYQTYEAYYINLDKCKFVLNQFKKNNADKLIQQFNQEFTNMIVENSGKRYDKNPNNFIFCKGREDYQCNIKDLCDMTINHETEDLSKRVKNRSLSDSYNVNISTKYIKK
jgi:hypothetical protein